MGMPHMVPRPLKGPFTVADYYRMAETGVLRPDARVELLDGLVVEMSPIGSRHAGCVIRLQKLFARAREELATVSTQNPVLLDDRSQPQPDLALLRPRLDDYAGSIPRPNDVLLLIEVADSSVESDRDVKLPLYARSGIPEVWLVDVDAATVELYQVPGAGGFAVVRKAAGTDVLTPLRVPTVTLRVADIFA